VFARETSFGVPEPRKIGKGRQKTKPRPDRKGEAIGTVIARQDPAVWETVTFRDGPDGNPMTSCFCFLRVRARNQWEKVTPFPPAEEWLIAECPDGHDQPTDYWISNLPADAPPEQLARLARCAGRSHSITSCSRASSDWINTRAAPGSGGITTLAWSPPCTDSSHSTD
jgi:hypothetical protein